MWQLVTIVLTDSLEELLIETASQLFGAEKRNVSRPKTSAMPSLREACLRHATRTPTAGAAIAKK